MVLAHPGGDEGHDREPKQKVQVGPENAAGDLRGRVQQVMVVVPVDPDVDEAQEVAHEQGDERLQVREVRAVRHLQFEHHDGDDDGEHAIAECSSRPLPIRASLS